MELPLELQITTETLKVNTELMSLIESKMGKNREIDVWSVTGSNPDYIMYCFATIDGARQPQHRWDYKYTGSGLGEASPDNYIKYLIENLKKYEDWNDDGNDGKQDTYSIGVDRVIAKVKRNNVWHKLEYTTESKFKDIPDGVVEKMIDLLKSGIRQNVEWENLRDSKNE